MRQAGSPVERGGNSARAPPRLAARTEDLAKAACRNGGTAFSSASRCLCGICAPRRQKRCRRAAGPDSTPHNSAALHCSAARTLSRAYCPIIPPTRALFGSSSRDGLSLIAWRLVLRRASNRGAGDSSRQLRLCFRRHAVCGVVHLRTAAPTRPLRRPTARPSHQDHIVPHPFACLRPSKAAT